MDVEFEEMSMEIYNLGFKMFLDYFFNVYI